MKLVFKLAGQTHEYDLDDRPTGTIGRSRSCSLRIRDHNISRVHAKFSLRDEVLTVSDEGSRNGVFVNGLRVSEASVPLGSSFKLGEFELALAQGTSTTGPIPDMGDESEDDFDDTISSMKRSKKDGSSGASGGDAEARTVASPTRNTPSKSTHPTPLPSGSPAKGSSSSSQAAPATSHASSSSSSQAAPASAAPASPPPSPLPSAPAAITAPPAVLLLPPGVGPETFTLNRQRIAIGSSPDNDLPVQDPKISRYHAEIRELDDVWILRDLGSRNGTLVNDERVEERVLKDGDRLTVGLTTLTFRIGGGVTDKARLVKIAVLAVSGLACLGAVGFFAAPYLFKESSTGGVTVSSPEKSEHDQFLEFLETGSARLEDALADGRYEAAERNYERAAKLTREAAVFLDLVKLYAKHARDLTAMPWAELEDLLKKAGQLKDPPPKTASILAKELARASLEKENMRLYADLLVLADGKKYREALDEFAKIDARSLFKAAFQPKVKDLRDAWRAACVAQVDKLITERRLEDALEAIKQANLLSDILDRELINKKMLCDQNIEDSANLLKAQKLLEGGKALEAGKLLESIRKDSFCFGEAQTLKRQIAVETLTAEVKELYRSGDGKGAVARISESPEKNSELDALAKKIEMVLRRWEAGIKAREDKDFKTARMCGLELQDMEPDTQNFYHQEGVSLTKETAEEAAGKELRAADDFFRQNKFAEAREHYEEVLRLMPGTQRALDAMKKLHDLALKEVNRINNDRAMAPADAVKRLKEVVEWLSAEDSLAQQIRNRIRDLSK
ncbi:MAG: FHA domain-containing protein [Planctomycetes bacterium]|nr:FHA domain-containing protein [Planctomycetota bacterium]